MKKFILISLILFVVSCNQTQTKFNLVATHFNHKSHSNNVYPRWRKIEIHMNVVIDLNRMKVIRECKPFGKVIFNLTDMFMVDEEEYLKMEFNSVVIKQDVGGLIPLGEEALIRLIVYRDNNEMHLYFVHRNESLVYHIAKDKNSFPNRSPMIFNE